MSSRFPAHNPVNGTPAPPPRPFAKDPLASRFPVLWSYLSEDKLEDGSPRIPSTLTIFAEAGMVKLCLNDRDLEVTAWASAGTLTEAADQLELALGDNRVDWRRPRGGTKSGRR